MTYSLRFFNRIISRHFNKGKLNFSLQFPNVMRDLAKIYVLFTTTLANLRIMLSPKVENNKEDQVCAQTSNNSTQWMVLLVCQLMGMQDLQCSLALSKNYQILQAPKWMMCCRYVLSLFPSNCL